MNYILANEAKINKAGLRSGVFTISDMVRWTTTLFLFSLVCYGPYRYFIAKLGLAELAYLPKILLLIAAIFVMIYFGRVNKILIVVGTVVAFYAAWGMVNLPSSYQPLFGVWVIIPLLYGLLSAQYFFNDPNPYKRIFIILFIIALSGVVINAFVQFPWVGSSFRIGGEQIEISRRWWALGISRIGGFSGASFDVAIQLLLLSICLMFFINSGVIKILLWIASGVGIAVTTTKGVFGAYLIITTFFITGKLSGYKLLWRQFWVAIFFINFMLLVFLPLSSIFIRYDPSFDGYYDRFIFESFGDRLNYTWPASFSLLHHGAEWLFGRGIGGIGTPQTYFEPTNALPADNLYVYLAVDFGPLFSAVMLLIVCVNTAWFFLRTNDSFLIFLILAFVISYGMVSNIIEAPMLSLFFGMVIGRSFQMGRET